MTQIANVLAVSTTFIGLWTLIPTLDSQRRGGAYMRDKNTYAELEPKVQGGGLMCEV